MSARRSHDSPRRTPRKAKASEAIGPHAHLAPITGLVSSKLLVVANLLRRGAAFRYRRRHGLAQVDWGLIAVLGRRAPISAAALAALNGMDKAQISRSVSSLVRRKLISRVPNPSNSREVLIGLTLMGLALHDAIVHSGEERNRTLLADFSDRAIGDLHVVLDRLTDRARELLAREQPRKQGRRGS